MKYLLGMAAGLLCLPLTPGCSVQRGGARAAGEQPAPSTFVDPASEADASGVEVVPASDASVAEAGEPSELPIGEDPRDVVIGYYAERRAFRTIQKVMSSIFSDDVQVLTTSYSLVQISRVGSRYVFREDACRVRVDNTGSFVSLAVTIADQVPQSIPQVESEIVVEEASGNITWVRPLTSAPVGFIPNGPDDVLPTTSADPRVRDSDGDGKPGVTAHVRGNVTLFTAIDGDLYLAQWNRARYAGRRTGDGRLEGENFDTSEQNVIGTNSQMLANNNPSIIADPNTADNRIVLTPLAAPMTCQTMLGQLETLFP